MSASEKLKALEPVAVHHDLHRLIDALPQIVAVVEMAESAAEVFEREGYPTDEWICTLGALDRALVTGVYGEWCRDPKSCQHLGYCPKEPTCAD